MDTTHTRARRMATTGLSGSPAASSSAQGRGSAAAFTGDHSMTATSVDGGILTITGAGSTDAENSMTAATSAAVSVAAKTSTAAVAGTRSEERRVGKE